MKKIYLISCFLLAFVVNFGQQSNPSNQPAAWVKMMQNPNANFYEVQQAFYEYWQGKTIQKGKGYKVFKRWEAYMTPRVYPTGEMTQASQAYPNFINWARTNPISTDKSTSGDWQLLGPVGAPSNSGAGRLNFVRFDPTTTNTIYVGAPDGGLWKSTNAGASWMPMTDQLTVIGCTDIAIDPTNTQTMYLATGDGDAADSYSIGILKSTDGGLTWNTTGLNWSVNQGRTISKIIMNPSNSSNLLVASNVGIFRTTDAGVTWTQEDNRSFKDMEFKPNDPNTIYAAGDVFVKSTNNGDTWSTITSGVPNSSGVQRIAIAVTEANENYVYILVGNNSDQGLLGVYRSTNSGTSFTQRHSSSPNLLGWESDGSDDGGQAFYDLTIAASPLNAEVIVIGGVNLWRSTNGGSSFTINGHWWGDVAPYVHADHHDIVFLPGTSTYFSANDGGLFKTTNNGSSWTDLSNNLAIAQQYRIGLSATTESLLVAGHQDNGTNKFSGTSWTNIYGGDGMDCFIDRTNNNTIIASYVYGEHLRSTNGGSTWTDIYSSLPNGAGNADWLSVLHQDPVTANTYYAGGRSQLYKTTNAGSSWTTLGSPSGNGNIVEFAIAPSNNQVIYALKSNGVSKSTNGGSSWTNISSGLPTSSQSPTYVTTSNTDANVVYVTFSGYNASNKVFKSTNGGSTWTNISTGLPNVPCNTIVFHNGSADESVYIGTDVGVFYRNNNLSSWLMFSNGLPRVAVRDLEIFYPTLRLRAGTYGRGTWDSDLYSNSAPPVADFMASSTSILTGQSITYSDLTTGLPTSYDWSFEGGDPSISTSINPIVTYNTAGIYTVSLTVTNDFGTDTETKINYVTVSDPVLPVADFTANHTTICPYQGIRFTSTSTGEPISHSWSFPGAETTSSTEQNPIVYYITPGVYSVTLTVTNNDGSDSETKTEFVHVGEAIGDELPFNEGFEADFDYFRLVRQSSNEFYWSLSGVGLGNTPTPDHSYTFDNATVNTTGELGAFWLPGVNLSNVSTASLTFDVAYARYSATYSDTLEVSVSNDCGETFYSVGYLKGGSDLATVPDNTSTFIPTSDTDWREETVDLSSFIGSENVIVRFMNIGGWGNMLYVDNINVIGTTIELPVASFTSNVSSVCEGTVVNFTSTSTGSPTSYSWSFPGGSPSISSDPNPIVTYTSEGNYDVELIATNDNGTNTKLINNYITVNTNPSPIITANGSTNLCIGESVTLSSNIAEGNSWNNGQTEQTITISEGDTYFVTVSDINGCVGTSNTIQVNNISTPEISVGEVTHPLLCGSQTGSIEILGTENGTLSWIGVSSGSASTTLPFTLNNLSAGIYTFEFSNGCLSNSLNVSLNDIGGTIPSISLSGSTTFCEGNSITLSSSEMSGNNWSTGATDQDLIISNSGSYFLTFTDINNCTSTSEIIVITVNQNPENPLITADGATTFCEGNNVNLSSDTGDNIIWSNGLPTQNIVVTSSGDYYVTITDENNCEAISNIITVTVNENPEIQIGSISNPSECNGTNGTIEISGTSNGLLNWNGPSTGSQNVSLPFTISNLAQGTYTFDFNNGCSSNSLNTSLVDPTAPTAPIITADGSINFCQGQSVNLSSDIANVNWSDGSTASSINVAASGSYSASITENGCTATSNTIIVTVNNNPATPSISSSNGTTFCQGSSTVLTSSVASGNTWSTNETSSAITVNSSGTFDVTVTQNGCSATSNSITIIVNPLPNVTISTIEDLCNNGSSFVLAQGLPVGGSYSGTGITGTNTFNPANANIGSNQVLYTFTDNNGCSNSASTSVNVINCASIYELSDKRIKVYPNPVVNYLIIEGQDISNYELIDQAGKIVRTNSILSSKTELLVTDIQAGMYYLKVYHKDTIILEKIEVLK
jgi:PKD repeat protein/photosystem II stability/assembly factor-like uncharacterized protein